MKDVTKVLLMVVLMCGVCFAAANNYYVQPTGSWHTGANWSPDGVIPLATENANIDHGPGASVTLSADASCLNLTVAHWYQNNTLTIDPGVTLTTGGNVVLGGSASGGGNLITSGIVSATPQAVIGAYGDAYLEINGGSFSATYFNAPGWWSNSTSAPTQSSVHVQLNGGTLNAWDFNLVGHLYDGITENNHGTMDITGGVLDISRAERARIENFVALGFLTGYGSGANIVIDDTSVAGHTIVTAIPEPMTLTLLGLGGLALIRRRRA